MLPPPSSMATRGFAYHCRNALPAALEPKAGDMRPTTDTETTARPRCTIATPVTSVNQPAGNCVGSTRSCRSGAPAAPSGRHQARARVWSATTGSSPETMPVDGPAPSPTPQWASPVHTSSASACAAAVAPPPPESDEPVRVTSPPSRRVLESGGVVAHKLVRAWLDHTDPGSEAREPEASAATVVELYRSAGDSMADPKLVPPGNRTVPTPTPIDPSVWAAAGRASTIAATTHRATPVCLTRAKLRGGWKRRRGAGSAPLRACCRPTRRRYGRWLPDWPPLWAGTAGVARFAGMVGTSPCPGIAGVGRVAGVAALGLRASGVGATTSPRRCVARCWAPWECSATMAFPRSDACSLGICGVCAATTAGTTNTATTLKSLPIMRPPIEAWSPIAPAIPGTAGPHGPGYGRPHSASRTQTCLP